MFISRDPALVDSGEFVLPLSNPVKWPLFFFPTQVVAPVSAGRFKFQRLSVYSRAVKHRSEPFSFSVPGALQCLEMLTFRERPRKASVCAKMLAVGLAPRRLAGGDRVSWLPGHNSHRGDSGGLLGVYDLAGLTVSPE